MDDKIELFLDYMEKVKRSSRNTLDSYRRDLKGMKEYFATIGVTDVGKINCTNINSYVLYLEKTGKSPATISRNISSIKTFFRCMINNGFVKREPTENVNVPEQIIKTNASEHKMTDEDKRRFIDSIECSDVKGIRDRAMFELLFDTGMKVSEITGIKLWDINLQYSFVICHGSKRDKTIAFGKNSGEAVYQYIKGGREAILKNRQSDYLFVNCFGNQLSRQGFWKLFKEYATKAGISDITTNSI